MSTSEMWTYPWRKLRNQGENKKLHFKHQLPKYETFAEKTVVVETCQ